MTDERDAADTSAALRKWLEALDDDHLSFEELSRYTDGLSSDEERSAIALHLEDCRMCSEEAADLSMEAARMSVGPQTNGAEDANVIEAAQRRRAENTRPAFWRRRAFLSVAASLVIAVALAVAIRTIRHTPPNPVRLPVQVASGGTRSMAILPLRNVSGKTAEDFMSVGIADALTTRMKEHRSLSMRSMPSILRVQRESPDLRTTAKKLQVDVVLEGQYLAVKDQMHVTLQLTEARSGHVMWAESVEGRRDDLLDLVDRLTVRTELRLDGRPTFERAGAGSEPRSANAQAYESYMRARSLSGSLVKANYAEQIRELRRATELDPRFAAAHADLAIALELDGMVRGLAPDDDVLNESERHARLAIELDPHLADAHLALGRALSTRRDHFPEAMREFVTAIELQPTNTHALQILTSYFVANGDLVRARCLSDRIMRLDPVSNEVRMRGYWSIEATDSSEALRQAELAFAAPDTELAAHDIRGLAFILQGNLHEADREADAALHVLPDHYAGESLKAMVAAARGDRAGTESWLAKFEGDSKRNHYSAFRVALCYAKLGDREAALDWIENATNLGHQGWYSLTMHPWLAPLRSDPRFQECVRRIKRSLDDARPDVLRAYALVCPQADPRPGNAVAANRPVQPAPLDAIRQNARAGDPKRHS